jgi:hypothetical protein
MSVSNWWAEVFASAFKRLSRCDLASPMLELRCFSARYRSQAEQIASDSFSWPRYLDTSRPACYSSVDAMSDI